MRITSSTRSYIGTLVLAGSLAACGPHPRDASGADADPGAHADAELDPAPDAAGRTPVSDVPRDDMWIVNGPVYAVARDDDTIYLGGAFTSIGPPTGSFAIDATTGRPDVSAARIDGAVLAAYPDGAGGWYIGGGFSTIDGVPRRHLAPSALVIDEVCAAGAPDWFEVVNATTRSIDLSDFVYVDVAEDLERARRFSAITLRPGERHVQFVDKAIDGFRIGVGEELWIHRAATGELVDGVDWEYGDSPYDGSYARVPSITGDFVPVARDTRGEPNG